MDKFDKETAKKAIEYIENNSEVHFALKKSFKIFDQCDPVDAYNDIKLLYQVFEAKIRY